MYQFSRAFLALVIIKVLLLFQICSQIQELWINIWKITNVGQVLKRMLSICWKWRSPCSLKKAVMLSSSLMRFIWKKRWSTTLPINAWVAQSLCQCTQIQPDMKVNIVVQNVILLTRFYFLYISYPTLNLTSFFWYFWWF